MLTYGWTETQLEVAAWIASKALGGMVEIEVRNPHVMSYRSRRGAWSVKSTLGFASKTSRYKEDGQWVYPAGVNVRDHVKTVRLPTFPVPRSEIDESLPPREYVEKTTRRSSGTLCFHAFGHFMRALFEMNKCGNIRTSLADYDGINGFNANHRRVGTRNVGSVANPMQARECCDCTLHNVEEF